MVLLILVSFLVDTNFSINRQSVDVAVYSRAATFSINRQSVDVAVYLRAATFFINRQSVDVTIFADW